jgi:hypothetical protein
MQVCAYKTWPLEGVLCGKFIKFVAKSLNQQLGILFDVLIYYPIIFLATSTFKQANSSHWID